ncbi:hypothetical protein K450DRAFT_253737 [Umbelopsis ramanniana AG]|uniref:Uncharacterized protein n=1 Tax=Umbelopsis ramanniana AG TaxID=1314678 RepID=A0AAD5E5A1_UMBRA|nr:uncharacterized protein K450DRAFT_253737 [Umbelopsis ramanniana AG]KAI8577117.1 hypothetical protein K450DRAFT_253737 [Umbelopsis ramanniana AG]
MNRCIILLGINFAYMARSNSVAALAFTTISQTVLSKVQVGWFRLIYVEKRMYDRIK